MIRKKKITMFFLSIEALSCIVGCGSQTTQSKQESITCIPVELWIPI